MNLCGHCSLSFHRRPDDGQDGCPCLYFGCGCRIKREKAK